MDDMVLNDGQIARLESLLTNAILSRTQFFNRMFDPRRDLAEECGYPRPEELTPERFKYLFDRDAIAGRVTELMAKECWRKDFDVYDDPDVKTTTKFEQSRKDLIGTLRPEQSWYQQDDCDPLTRTMLEADVMAGISGYSIVLFGFDDVESLGDLARPVTAGKRTLLFTQAYPESLAPVSEYVTEATDRRMGMPLTYRVALNDPTTPYGAAMGVALATVDVHYSRVVHIPSDEVGTSRVRRPSRMESVLDNILAAQKPYHASTEGYWKTCFTTLVFKTLAQLAGRVKINKDRLTATMADWENSLQRWFAIDNMDVMPISPSLVDPTPYIASHLEAICIRKDIPLSIFKGTERADVKNVNDRTYWNDKCVGRNRRYTIPSIVVPVTDKLIATGVYEMPGKSGYRVSQEELSTVDAATSASTEKTRVDTIASYVGGNVSSLIGPMDFFTRFLGFDEDDAKTMLENALAETKEQGDPAADGAGPAPGGPLANRWLAARHAGGRA